MLFQKRKKVAVIATKKIKAFTLTEFIITSSLMLVILFSLSSFYQNNYRNNKKLDTQLFLQQQANQILNHLKPHLEHLYFQGGNRKGSNYALFYDNSSLALEKNCLIFFYDFNNDGCVGKRRSKKRACKNNNRNATKYISKEIFGFKLEQQQILEVDIDKKQDKCSLTKCKQILSYCQKGRWTALTDRNNFQVSQLQFSWLQEPSILKVTLTLAKDNLTYSTQAYIYVLNHQDSI